MLFYPPGRQRGAKRSRLIPLFTRVLAVFRFAMPLLPGLSRWGVRPAGWRAIATSDKEVPCKLRFYANGKPASAEWP
jgi:hypothetical protein